MKPWSMQVRGRFEEHVFESSVLRDNPLGDPAERPVCAAPPSSTLLEGW